MHRRSPPFSPNGPAPPGATRASNSASASYPQWQENFYGPWWNWTLVPQEKKDKWWSDFVQSYYWAPEHHNLVSFHWKEEVKDSIGNLVSKRKRSGVRPPYINESDWNLMLEEWSTEPALKKSKSAATSRISSKDGRGMHKHTAGAQSFLKIEYDMMIASGGNDLPAFTEVVRKTHTRKDGTFVDFRAETIITEVEASVMPQSTGDGSPTINTASSTAIPSRLQLNEAYLATVQPYKGRIFGLGSIQSRYIEPNQTIHASLSRHLDMEIKVAGLESEFRTFSSTVTNNMDAMRQAQNVLLRANGIDPDTLLPMVPPPNRSTNPCATPPAEPDAVPVAFWTRTDMDNKWLIDTVNFIAKHGYVDRS